MKTNDLPLLFLLLMFQELGYRHIIYHYSDVIMGAMASQITSLTIVYSTVYSGADQRKHQSSASLAFVRGIHRWSVNSPHKWSVTWKMFPFDYVIMTIKSGIFTNHCRIQSQEARICVYADGNLGKTLSCNVIYLHHHYHSCKCVICIYIDIFKIYMCIRLLA